MNEKVKTELGKDVLELMEDLEQKYGAEKMAQMLFVSSISALQELHGKDYVLAMLYAVVRPRKPTIN